MYCTYHPPCRVSVKPNRESRSTDTRIPMIPNPCGVMTWPRITDTRLHTLNKSRINETKQNRWRKKRRKKNDLEKNFHMLVICHWNRMKSINVKENIIIIFMIFNCNLYTFFSKLFFFFLKKINNKKISSKNWNEIKQLIFLKTV